MGFTKLQPSCLHLVVIDKNYNHPNKKSKSAVAQWYSVRLKIEGSLVRDSPEVLSCVLKQEIVPSA